jgi:ABC-type multidrug transport system permease subunit
VLAGPSTLPGFWIFLYRVSPFNYLIGGILSTALANTNVVCASNEYLHFNPTSGTCTDYMAPYINAYGGYLENPNATVDCSFCSISSTNDYLASVTVKYSQAWRNLGLMFAYISFNIAGALLVYWLFRVPKAKEKTKK